jgi:hypothetical protein
VLQKLQTPACVPVYVLAILTRQRLGKDATAAGNTLAAEELLEAHFLCGQRHIIGK